MISFPIGNPKKASEVWKLMWIKSFWLLRHFSS